MSLERWRGLLRTCCPLGRGAVDTGSWSQRLTAGLNLGSEPLSLPWSVPYLKPRAQFTRHTGKGRVLPSLQAVTMLHLGTECGAHPEPWSPSTCAELTASGRLVCGFPKGRAARHSP